MDDSHDIPGYAVNAVRAIRDALLKELGAKDSEFSKRIITGFTESFQEYLRSIAQAAEIPIE